MPFVNQEWLHADAWPGGCLQLIQGKLADMYTVMQAARALVYQTAQSADQGRADRKDCAAAILYAAEHATRIALDAIQVWLLFICMSAAVVRMLP